MTRCHIITISVSFQLLDILEEFVISKGMVYSRLDGSTKPADRTRLVREFNLDPSISLCLVSTKAGGLGLNFTGANVVIIFDPNWNPSSDLQAQDRLVKGTNTHGLLTHDRKMGAKRNDSREEDIREPKQRRCYF